MKLKYLDNWIKRRNLIASFYLNNIKNEQIKLPSTNKNLLHVYHLFVVRCTKRDELKDYLTSNGIETGIHYPIALPKLEAYSYHTQNCSNFLSCSLDSELLSLPIGEHLEDKEIQRIVNVINKFETI